MVQCVQRTLDGHLDLWPGAAEVWRFVGAPRTTRYQAQQGVDEFWIRTRTVARAQTCAHYILRNGFMWESGKKGVEVFVGTLRVRWRGHRDSQALQFSLCQRIDHVSSTFSTSPSPLPH